MAYPGIVLAGVPRHLATLLFVVAAAAPLLLSVGIHNACDTVTCVRWAQRSRDAETP